MSSNSSLAKIYCTGNQLTSLDVSSNEALIDLRIDDNQLSSLDVSSNPNLAILLCHNNQISDLTLNTNIQNLYCGSNQLTSLDVSQTDLTIFNCAGNQLTYLNIKSLETKLNSFYASSNFLNCIETLDPSWASENWTYENGSIDEDVTFDVICNSEARTGWYVSTTGSDLFGSGTTESPLSSIQVAINASTDGDTVSVAAGTYTEKNIEIPNEEAICDWCAEWERSDRETTIIDGGGHNTKWIFR